MYEVEGNPLQVNFVDSFVVVFVVVFICSLLMPLILDRFNVVVVNGHNDTEMTTASSKTRAIRTLE